MQGFIGTLGIWMSEEELFIITIHLPMEELQKPYAFQNTKSTSQ